MKFLTLKDGNFQGKKVIVRADFDVPIKNRKIQDDTRIRAALPTIQYLIKKKAIVILLAHIGRPNGKVVEELRTDVIGKHLEKLLNKKILNFDDCIGETIIDEIEEMKNGEVCLLENVRFYSEEEKNNSDFAEELSELGDMYVNDSFATAHRAHASIVGVTKFLPSHAGLQLEKEIKILSMVMQNPKKPFVAILGGVKVSDKIKLVEQFVKKCDAVIIGGAMAFSFLKTFGYETGKNFAEKETGLKKLLKTKKIILPLDFKCGKRMVKSNNIRKNDLCFDIGRESVKYFCEIIKNAKTIVWNGPMGKFEEKGFEQGTKQIAKCIAWNKKAFSVAGGGDSVSAIKKYGLEKGFKHLSTGGGAMLEFLEGKKLPGIKALQRR